MGLEEKFVIIRNNEGQEVVQMDMDVFKAIESYIEDHGLLQAMLEDKSDEDLNLDEAREYYSKLDKDN